MTRVWTRAERVAIRRRVTVDFRRPRTTPRIVGSGPLGLVTVYEDPAPEWVVEILRAVFRVSALELDGGEALARAAVAWVAADPAPAELRRYVEILARVQDRRDPKLADEIRALLAA